MTAQRRVVFLDVEPILRVGAAFFAVVSVMTFRALQLDHRPAAFFGHK